MLSNPEYQLKNIISQTDYKIVLAESCTGGLTSSLITNIPGSSDYFLGGIVAYSNEVKQNILGVNKKTLEIYGAVSKETVIEMAVNIRKIFSRIYAEDKIISASISGIAGPGGATEDKPVGLVWIAISHNNDTKAYKHLWDGNRIDNKILTAQECIRLIIKEITEF